LNLRMRYRTTGACVAMVFSSLCGFSSAVLAQETAWTPPVPVDAGQDWIKLTSGEWVRGEIKSLREGTLEFDSEKLDLLKLDWGDVAEIQSPRNLQYVFSDGHVATGTAVLQAGVAKIRVGAEVSEFQAAQIVSIVEGAASEWDRWSAKASLGLVSRSGNTDQLDYNALVFLRREGGRTRFDTNYVGNFGKIEGVQNVNNHLLNSKLDAFLTQRLFVTPISIELYSDRFQNTDLRGTLAVGFGYDVLQSAVDWYLQLRGGYVRTNYRSVESGQDDVEDSGAVIPSTSLEWDPTSDIETSLSYTATVSVPEVENTFHHLVALMDVGVYSILDFTFSIAWDRVESPKPREDGSSPQRDDFRLAFGLGIDL
jgi:hypothetical protein